MFTAQEPDRLSAGDFKKLQDSLTEGYKEAVKYNACEPSPAAEQNMMGANAQLGCIAGMGIAKHPAGCLVGGAFAAVATQSMIDNHNQECRDKKEDAKPLPVPCLLGAQPVPPSAAPQVQIPKASAPAATVAPVLSFSRNHVYVGVNIGFGGGNRDHMGNRRGRGW